MTTEVTGTCVQCGASIYRQHIESGIARYVDGKLLCPHCVNECDRGQNGSDLVMEPIVMDGEDEAEQTDVSVSKFKTETDLLGSTGGWDDSRFQRPADPKSPGATRCRTFHTKLSEAAVAFMNNQINEWLDQNPNIVIKFSTSTIGVFEGKHAEPNLLLTVFY